MTCDRFHTLVSDWLDGDIDATQRAALEAHAETCDACRALMTDLRDVRHAATTLERQTPPSQVWTRLEQQLAGEPRFREAATRRATGIASIAEARARARTRLWSWRSPTLALAASLLLMVGASLYFLHRWSNANPTPTPSSPSATGPATPGVTPPGNAPAGALVESIDSELQQAAAHYEKAIAGLEQVANASDSPLDPDVMAALHRNLGVIDKAITESRTALASQPNSRLAQTSLFDAFRRKVALLQDTIALMNELRKGDQAGAARVASGLNKS
jgi:anti-sigma factor RsiW